MSTQLMGEVRAPLPAEPGKPLRYDTEYKRNGTANIFIAFEPLVGQRYTKVTEQRTKVDWAHFIKELVDQHYPHVQKIWWCTSSLRLIPFPRKPGKMPPGSRHVKGVRHDATPIFLNGPPKS
jgi:hypothetical protein